MKKVNGDDAMRRMILSAGIILVLPCICVAVTNGEQAVRHKIEFMRSEIEYLDSEHGPADQKWQNYKREVEGLADRFQHLLRSAMSPAKWVPELAKKSEELHTKIPLRLPAGPKGTGRFGAYYVRLKYSLTWDKLWKVSEHPDVVVRFDEFDHRFIFWRGTSYIPCWATYDGAWYTNEFFERRGRLAIHTGSPQEHWIEYQEGIVVNQPGTIPEENINFDAVSFANLKGESKTYKWTKDGGPPLRDPPDNPCIQVINFKNPHKPFTVVNPDGVRIKVYGGQAGDSHFNWWNHWPLNQGISDTTVAKSSVRPSHSSLTHIEWKQYSQEGLSRTWIMLNGMTNKPAAELVPLARSWLYAPQLKLSSRGYRSEGYDQAQRAYVLSRKEIRQFSALNFELAASKESPVVNPAFVIENWGSGRVTLVIDGKRVGGGKRFRTGHRKTLGGGDLIVWVKGEWTKPVKISLRPVWRSSL